MEMEQVLTDALMHRVNENQGSICQDTTKEAEDFHMMIPIMNEEQLFIFEEKLLEKSFKLIVVSKNITQYTFNLTSSYIIVIINL